ncbi:flagellar motor switch protein FliM [Eubacteriales bacterium OttesenSCG-928-N14]|nr:flagellar motor switch protein FliM [Eubacteriales bacterium OttesenSCG-928-N14]
MANILSQSEIDELLSALAAGNDPVSETVEEVQEDEIRKYDFRTANKFSKEQMRTLQLIYDNYALRLGTVLAGALRAICDVELISVEEQAFNEFSNSLPPNALLAILNMPPLQGNAMLEIPTSIAYEIISRVFGGTGEPAEGNKSFTEIELAILTRALRLIIAPMPEAWERVVGIDVSLDRVETSAQFAQIVQGNEPIAIITMNFTIGDVSDLVNLVIPHVAMQPISKQLAMRTWYADSAPKTVDDNYDYEITPQLAATEVTLHAVFDDTSAQLREVLMLQVGDVIRIDQSIHKSLTVKVEHIPKFKGYIGTREGRYAIQVSEILEEDKPDE